MVGNDVGTILVTGATGFIGGHLVQALTARGNRVRCLVRSAAKAASLPQAGIERIVSPLEDRAALEASLAAVDCVFHLAGVTAGTHWRQLEQVNIQGTARLVAACAAQPRPPVLVLVSSVAASGPTRRGQLRTEDDPPRPVSWYGWTKLGGEQAAARLADRVPTTIVRPGIVFGPGDREMRKVFLALRHLRLHAIPGYPLPPLSYIYVEDLVRLLLAAADRGRRLPAPCPSPPTSPKSGQGRYFACCPEYPDYQQLGRLIRTAVGRPRALLLPLPQPLAWLAAGASELSARLRRRPDTFSFDKLREAVAPSWACSPAAAHRDLDFQPTRPLADRIQETADWYRHQGWL